ncbi:karyopherin, partial [Coemansia helicoidea]
MMAGAVDQRVLQALELVYAADTPVAQRREAEDVCQQLRESAQGPAYGVQLARASNGYSPMARHFGLQLIEHALRYRWGAGKKGGQLGSDECLQLRDQVWELVFDACPRPGSGGGGGGGQRDPQYISEKLVAVLAML